MSVSHTSFLNVFPAYQKNCGLKVGPMVITKAINIFIWKSPSWNMEANHWPCPLVTFRIHEIQIIYGIQKSSNKDKCINKRVFKKEYQSKLTKQWKPTQKNSSW